MTNNEFTIKVLEVIDQEDNSAIVTFDINKEAKEALIEYAILNILTKAANDRLQTVSQA